METITADGQAAHSEWPYSGFWHRVAATVIDNLILIIPLAMVSAFTFGIGAIILLIAYGTYFGTKGAGLFVSN